MLKLWRSFTPVLEAWKGEDSLRLAQNSLSLAVMEKLLAARSLAASEHNAAAANDALFLLAREAVGSAIGF